MDLGLKQRSAVVLASSKGLGLAVAEALAAEGARIMITGRNGARLREAADRLAAGGAEIHCHVGDMAEPDFPAALSAAAEARLGDVDILVNNSGGPPPKAARDVTAAEWTAQFAAMVLPVMETTRLLVPGMVERGWGRVLTLGSSGIVQPIPNLAISNALRMTLVGWSKTLAAEVASSGVTVNMLLPGRIATERTRELDSAAAKRQGRSVEEVAGASAATIPVGRYGRPEEFAATAAFLLGDAARYMTGGVIRADGGLIRSSL